MKRFGIILIAILLMAFPLLSQTVSIPDSTFLSALCELGVDSNGDKLISFEEAEVVSSLNLSKIEDEFPPSPGIIAKSGNIINLKGIEAFTNLVSLNCSFNRMCNPDFSKNVKLKHLDISFCGLSSLDVSNCTSLEVLNCSFNKLVRLDLSNNELLTELDCFHNRIVELNISNSASMAYLDCGFNRLTCLDIAMNTQLQCIRIEKLPDLRDVQVWTKDFPPPGVEVHSNYSPNICFIADCTSEKGKVISESLKIYPNPTREKILIEFSNWNQSTIEIISGNGQLIYSQTPTASLTHIDLSSFQKGIYSITVRSKDFVASRQIIKL